MLDKEESGTVECVRPGPSLFAYDESTCRPSSDCGHSSVRALDRRGFSATPRGRREVHARATVLAGLLHDQTMEDTECTWEAILQRNGDGRNSRSSCIM